MPTLSAAFKFTSHGIGLNLYNHLAPMTTPREREHSYLHSCPEAERRNLGWGTVDDVIVMMLSLIVVVVNCYCR